jgi:hypothetical protein
MEIKHLSLHGSPRFTQIGLKIYHLATLAVMKKLVLLLIARLLRFFT